MNEQQTLDSARESVLRAVDKYRAERAALFTFDGKPINAPDVHNRELERIAQPLAQSVDRAIQASDRVLAQVESLRVQPYADPTVAMAAVDLDDANRRRVFVAEDCATMPLGDLENRLRWLFDGGGPRSLMFLYGRYAKARLSAEDAKTPPDPHLATFAALLREHGITGPAAGLSKETAALGAAAGRLAVWARAQQTGVTNGTGKKMSL